MKVTNNTSFPIIAFGWHTARGYGEDVLVLPGEAADVSGPYLGEMGGGDCYVHIPGEITCQESPDDDHGFQVDLGNQLNLLQRGDRGVTVRHADEGRMHPETADDDQGRNS